MSKLTLNFFGDSVVVPKPKDLPSLRRIISLKFFLTEKDAEEILLNYTKKGEQISITTEEDYEDFFKSKINKIDLDISEKSKIYEESFKKLQEESLKDQEKLKELINKNKELEELKKTKFESDVENLKSINSKIVELTAMRNQLKKKITEGTKLIEKEIKVNEKKIKQLQAKLKPNCIKEKALFPKTKQVRKDFQKATQVKTKPLIGDLQIKHEDLTQTINWTSYTNATTFDVYHAESCYAKYTKIATVNGTSYTHKLTSTNKYANYYKVAVAGSDQLSDPISIEIDLFGDNVHIFAPSDDREAIYTKINEIYKVQAAVDSSGNPTPGQQFGSGRHTFAFKTGDYSTMNADNYDMSYYMQIIGLGKLPSDVKLKNIHVPAVLPDNNVTCNFWMNVENFELIQENVYHTEDVWFQFLWSVSQAAPARRLNVKRPSMLDWYYGWASGGYIADSVFEGQVGSYPQQQYYIRNCKLNKNW